MRDDNQTPFIHQSLYERMKARGVRLDWYERTKARLGGMQIPLDDRVCNDNAIYVIRPDGSLWTLASDNKPYHKVREGNGPVDEQTYICVCCKAQANTFDGIVHS